MSKIALVTGASSGIGEAIAQRLASLGYTTYAAARRIEQMEKLKERGVRVLRLDLTEEKSIRDCVANIQEESGGVDVLVNNAGYGAYGSLEEVPIEEARREFEVNLFGVAAISQPIIKYMRERRKGTIINISSIGGTGAAPYGGWYHATKFALEAYSSSLRQELSPFDVDVVIVRPGAIKSGWRDIAGRSLLKWSGEGPYAKAVQAAFTTFNSEKFDKMTSDPVVIADVIEKIIKAKHPKVIYTSPQLARNIVLANQLMLTDRIRDGMTRRFIGLPKKM